MGTVYLIPSLLAEGATSTIPAYVADAIKSCSVFFAENERTTRRYFKQLWKAQLTGQDIVIDDYEWYTISDETNATFISKLKEGKTIGIISEAGCPGVADPGQALIAMAQKLHATVKPLVGPSSILLALMASGMNGQQFQFVGYLPIDSQQRIKAIKDLEAESKKKDCTQIFIETPYRNNQLIETLLKICQADTRLCIASELTGAAEYVYTKTIAEWRKGQPDIHKKTAIFLLHSN